MCPGKINSFNPKLFAFLQINSSSFLFIFFRKRRWVRAGKMRGTIQEILQPIRAYKEVQLLCAAYNRIHRQSLIPLLIWSGIICFSASTFFLVATSDNLNPLAAAVFGNAVIMGATLLLFCFHFPARLISTSRKTLRSLQREQELLGGVDMKFGRKSMKSLRPVRIRFLHSNFFDRLTPVNLFIFASKIAIKLTLIKK